MHRRIVSYILFFTVAAYAAGLPTFVHYLVEHGPDGHAIGHTCCSHGCSVASHTSDAPSEVAPGEQEPESHDCDICQMLATSHAAVPTVPLLVAAGRSPPTVLLQQPASLPVNNAPAVLRPRGPPSRNG